MESWNYVIDKSENKGVTEDCTKALGLWEAL